MFDLTTLTDSLEELIGAFDPSAVEASDAVALLERFDRIARLAGAGQALCAARIEETGAWRRQGYRDAAGFIAGRTCGNRAGAKDALSIGARLSDSARFGRAMRSGALSLAQAADIANTLAERPDAEDELLGAAHASTVRELRATCVEILSRGAGAEERHARNRAARFCTSSVGVDGQWRLNAGLTVTDGALVDKVLEYFQNEAFDDARAEGMREPFTAYRADALVRMARAAMAGGGEHRLEHGIDSARPASEGGAASTSEPSSRRQRRRRPRSRSSSLRHAIIVTVPHTTFLSGTPLPGETCRIPGVGPVPLSEVEGLLEHDPIIKCIVTRGRDITATATMTRTIKEDLRLAILHRHDYQCAVPGCTGTRFVQLDHELDFAKDGPTDYDNLRPLCSYHHNQRTREGYELSGAPGSYRWTAPDGSVLAADPDPPNVEHSPERIAAPA